MFVHNIILVPYILRLNYDLLAISKYVTVRHYNENEAIKICNNLEVICYFL